MSLDQCLRARRSCREFAPHPVTLAEAAHLLWAAQGVTGLGGLRAAPSAGATYPLRIYLLVIEIAGVVPGVYRYDPDAHLLTARRGADLREPLVRALNGQEVVADAAGVILLAANYRRMIREFGERGVRLTQMEAGHAGQNVCLEATALGLGVIGMGAFDDEKLKELAELPDLEEPLYAIAFGHRE